MRGRRFKAAAVVLLIMTTLLLSVIHAAALDDTYSFKELGFSVKLPKEDTVITVNTPRGDAAFSKVGLDYDETMIAFKNANIYLRAYDPDQTYQISMTVTKDENTEAINNYSDITTAERKVILDTIAGGENVDSAVEVKHGGNIFIDSQSTISTGEDSATYINMCNTVINGMQINLTLQKEGEAITPEEAKELTNAAGSLNFDKIKRNTGAVFDWWRLLLWVGVLAALSIAVTVIYKQYNASVKRKNEERLKARRASRSDDDEAQPAHADKEEEITFEESLGYKDDEEFAERADADEMAGYDIKIRDRDPNKGIEYFEDEGSNIDDGTDYFDTYFKEQTEQRSGILRFFSTIWFYIRLAFRRIGLFFKNLINRIFKR